MKSALWIIHWIYHGEPIESLVAQCALCTVVWEAPINEPLLKVKCIAMDSNETMFVTGSADGDIKVNNILKGFADAHMLLDTGVGFDLSASDPVLPSGAFKAWPLQKHKSRSGSGLLWLRSEISNTFAGSGEPG